MQLSIFAVYVGIKLETMAKRFIDTTYFKSPFVRQLDFKMKAFYLFVICDCDGAGIWNADFEIASLYIGTKITQSEFKKSFLETNKAIDLKNGRYFFPDFIEHQYPKGLSNHNPAQKNFISELIKYSLISTDLKPLWATFKGTKVMVMEKDMVEVMEKEEVKPFNFKSSLLKLCSNEKLIDEWMQVRKKKKAVNTETALKGFISEQQKTNKGLEEIIEMCVQKSWAGFDASWIQQKQLPNGSTMQERAQSLQHLIDNPDWAK